MSTWLPGVVPWDELDPPIVELVRVLNEFDGISTIGSCGGHENAAEPGSVSAPANEWWVTFELEPADPDGETNAPSGGAWLDLEFLVYWVNRCLQRQASVVPYAMPPQLNFPGRMLRFELSGLRDGDGGVEPDEVAAWIRKGLDELYVAGEGGGEGL